MGDYCAPTYIRTVWAYGCIDSTPQAIEHYSEGLCTMNMRTYIAIVIILFMYSEIEMFCMCMYIWTVVHG